MLDRKGPNPYLMAVLTAFLTAIVTLTGNYFTSRAQMSQFLAQNQLNMRRSAYSSLLEKLDRVHSPVLSTILNVGSMDHHVSTDMEIQELEEILYEIRQKNKLTDLYWQLNSDLKIVRLNGSQQIQDLSDDLLKVLALRYDQINISKYPKSLQDFYKEITKMCIQKIL
jgi:hypothetical protein